MVPAESLYTLASHRCLTDYGRRSHWEPTLDTSYCLRCNRVIAAGSKSVTVYMFAQTVGIRPRQKSAAQRICFCPQCSVSLAMGPAPEGALNIVAWNMIRDMVSSDPALSEAAWQGMHDIIGLLPPEEPENLARRAVGGGYFEF
jgi:hypothetical protein